MIKKEFMEISSNVFRASGCRQYKKKFVYEHEDMFIIFMLVRSNFSDSYYHDFNVAIKKLHPEIDLSKISEKDFDFIVQPRLILGPDTTPLELIKFNVNEYERLLKEGLEEFLNYVNEKGLMLLKEYGKKGYDLTKVAKEFLNNELL